METVMTVIYRFLEVVFLFFFVFPVQNVYDHGIFQRHFLFHQYFHFIFIAPFLYYTIIRTWVLFVDTDNDKNIFFPFAMNGPYRL